MSLQHKNCTRITCETKEGHRVVHQLKHFGFTVFIKKVNMGEIRFLQKFFSKKSQIAV